MGARAPPRLCFFPLERHKAHAACVLFFFVWGLFRFPWPPSPTHVMRAGCPEARQARRRLRDASRVCAVHTPVRPFSNSDGPRREETGTSEMATHHRVLRAGLPGPGGVAHRGVVALDVVWPERSA